MKGCPDDPWPEQKGNGIAILNPPLPTVTKTFTVRMQDAAKQISRERDLIIAVLFLVLGFVFGKL